MQLVMVSFHTDGFPFQKFLTIRTHHYFFVSSLLCAQYSMLAELLGHLIKRHSLLHLRHNILTNHRSEFVIVVKKRLFTHKEFPL